MESVIDTQTLTNFINSSTSTQNHVNDISVSDSIDAQNNSISSGGNNVTYVNPHSNICMMSSDECSNNVILYYSTSFNQIAQKVATPISAITTTVQQPVLTQQQLAKLEKLRKLQDRVDKHEADKESLVNHIYDLRQLLQKINADGESKLVYLKSKNLAMKTEITQLLKALEISRKNSTHFAQISSYWGYCVNSNSWKNNDCDDDDCHNDHHHRSTETKKTNKLEKFDSASSSTSTQASYWCTSVPTLSTYVSVGSGSGSESIIGGGKNIICAKSSKSSERSPVVVSDEEPEMKRREEPENMRRTDDLLLQQQDSFRVKRAAAKSADKEELLLGSSSSCEAADLQ